MFSVSVGICAHNEEKTIGKLLEQILAEKINLKEIIVVASGCTDNTVKIVEEMRRRNRKIKLVIENDRKGQAHAQNIILENATGEIILLTDGDGLIKKNSLKNLIEPLSNPNISAVHGRPIPAKQNTFAEKILVCAWDLHHKLCLVNPKVTTELCAFKRNDIKRIPENLILDDYYMAYLLNKQRLKTVYVPSAIKFMYDDKSSIFKYLRWRRKDFRGYLQLRQTGIKIARPIWLKLVFYIKGFIEKLYKNPLSSLYMVCMIVVEIIAASLAYFDVFHGKIEYIWERD